MTKLSRRPVGEESAGSPRPFLPESSRAMSVEADSSAFSVGVRAYLMTGGRAAGHLAFETMLATRSMKRPAHVQFERAAILEVCDNRALSVAEVSAYMHIPIGVVRILASDLINEGLLVAHGGPSNKANDITLLTQLIDGVRAL
jgi:hypothetical protein